MKKLLAIAMCLALMLTSFVFVSAEADATITVETVEGPFAKDDEIVLIVDITEYYNAYSSITLEFSYDKSLLELDDIAQGSGISGGLGTGNAEYDMYGLIASPSKEREAVKLRSGDVCELYFYALADINTSVPVTVTAEITGYVYGAEDNWTESKKLTIDVVNGGIHVEGGDSHECAPSGDIQYDETSHWYECETVGCGNKVQEGPHEGGEATCVAKAVCSVCGASYGSANAENHAGETEVRNAEQADCGNAGYTGDTYCLDCNKMIDEGEAIPATGAHTGGTATCCAKAECGVCGAEYGEFDADNHDGETEVRGASNTYTGDTYCLGCGEMIDEGEAILPNTGSAIVSGGTVLNGEEIEVTVSLGNNTAIAAYGATLVYDDSALELVALAKGDFCNDVNINTGFATGFSSSNVTSGTLFKATFKALKIGEYSVSVEFDPDSTGNSTGTEITMTTTPGTITVNCKHTGGTATCISKAVCDVCDEEYGEFDADNHVGETEIRDDAPASCYEDGYTGDTYCLDCGEMIEEGETIPATGNHVPEAEYDYDETDHWYNCETVGCGNKLQKAPHEGGEATCDAKAVCSVCGVEYGEFDADNHVGETEVRNAAPADCGNDGYTGDTYCLDCGEMIEEGEPIPATGAHTGGTATCCAKAECDVCGNEYGDFDADNHDGETEVRDVVEASCNTEGYTGDTYCLGCGEKIADGRNLGLDADNHEGPEDEEYGYDEENHWFTCVCGEEVDAEPHEGGEATCVDQAECEICGQPYGDLDEDGHFGGEATCFEKAVCEGCGEEYGELDANNHKNTEEREDGIYCVDCGELVEENEPAPEQPAPETNTDKSEVPGGPLGDASAVGVAGVVCLAAAAAFVFMKKRG